jgi:hypothetical protein
VEASPALQVRRVQIHGADVPCDVSTGVARPLVPAHFRSAVFAAIHGLAHPGIRPTRRLESSRFVWHGCASDVVGWCRDCQTCQRGKVTRQPAAATQHPGTGAAFHTPPCGLGEAAPHFDGGDQVPLHHH